MRCHLSSIDYLQNIRIGVATVYGKPYYRFSACLKALDLSFDSILPEEITSYSGDIVLTTRTEYPQRSKKVVFYEDISKRCPPSVIRGILIQKLDLHFQEDDLVIGVDPGQRLVCLYYTTGWRLRTHFTRQ